MEAHPVSTATSVDAIDLNDVGAYSRLLTDVDLDNGLDDDFGGGRALARGVRAVGLVDVASGELVAQVWDDAEGRKLLVADVA